MSDYFAAPETVLPLWRKADPDTSKAAGQAARETGLVGRHERLILAALEQGPGTKDEIAGRTSELNEQQVARRMHGLHRAGLVEPTGSTRPSRSGRPERVWKATAASR
jgi:predicted ArsR family transcriptional regulator